MENKERAIVEMVWLVEKQEFKKSVRAGSEQDIKSNHPQYP